MILVLVPSLHSAKAFAIAKNTVSPEIPDPVVNHTASGSFFLGVESAYMQPVKTAQAEPTNDYAPALDQTQGYYLNSIEQAVADGEINKAMQLLEEAERLGIKDARNTFVSAVENK
ncbi:hypothetical protein C9I98_06575 [Photobacterium sanctipauli]|uniref:Uncharacterized protein n=1 Tax=Photobacterium sanctipauli TaxID=1342794 RepID=A0A2T3NWA7_9GAMM|nr:hypothetical protein C9I98_06575 [Photobacterium sanctipauli]